MNAVATHRAPAQRAVLRLDAQPASQERIARARCAWAGLAWLALGAAATCVAAVFFEAARQEWLSAAAALFALACIFNDRWLGLLWLESPVALGALDRARQRAPRVAAYLDRCAQMGRRPTRAEGRWLQDCAGRSLVGQ